MTRPTPDDASPDLLDAIEDASRELGVTWKRPARAPAVSLDPPPRRARWPWVVLATLTTLLLGAAWLSIRPSAHPPAHVVERDLRWAVARTVERVESFRTSRGRLPRHDELYGLLGDAVRYEPSEAGYRVVGERAGVVVTWDGSLPLDVWRGLALHPPPDEEGG